MLKTVLILGVEYQVDASNDLIIKRRGKGYIKSFPDRHGYLKYSLLCKGVNYNIFVHKFVWELHKGTVPEGYTIDHKDNNKLNNHIDNLQLLTAKENAIKGNARNWVVFRPDGSSIPVYNIEEFCRNNGLHPGHMRATSRNNRKHKGWYCNELA